MVRNPGGSKVEDELYEKKGEWDETEPEEEEDGLREEDRQHQYGFHIYAKVIMSGTVKNKRDLFGGSTHFRSLWGLTLEQFFTSTQRRVQVKGTSLARAFSNCRDLILIVSFQLIKKP